MSKKILIATGGTGGHVYPAMALAQQLKTEIPDCEVLFVGGGLSQNRYFDRTAFSHRTVSCSAFGSSPKLLFSCLYNVAKGIWQSQRILREFKPDVAVGFGSYYAFPPLVAAKIMSIPLVLHEANSIPGKVNRVLSLWANVTGVHFPETVRRLKGKAIEVGMPLRLGFRRNIISREIANDYFGLQPHLRTLLVFGGSQGARSINSAVREALSNAKHKVNMQVLHIAGDPAMAKELQQHYAHENISAVVKSFEDRMEMAWQAADLVICRSGAGALAEQLEFEVPGILIPFPRAADNHQEFNADFMVATVGGAVKILDKGLTAERLVLCLEEFLKNDGALLAAMQQSMAAYKKKARNKDLCSLVKELL